MTLMTSVRDPTGGDSTTATSKQAQQAWGLGEGNGGARVWLRESSDAISLKRRGEELYPVQVPLSQRPRFIKKLFAHFQFVHRNKGRECGSATAFRAQELCESRCGSQSLIVRTVSGHGVPTVAVPLHPYSKDVLQHVRVEHQAWLPVNHNGANCAN